MELLTPVSVADLSFDPIYLLVGIQYSKVHSKGLDTAAGEVYPSLLVLAPSRYHVCISPGEQELGSVMPATTVRLKDCKELHR